MKRKDRCLITLVGIRQAREGYAFIHRGASARCRGCERYRVCIGNLEVGRVYKVVGLRERVFPCELHEVGVRVVEVVEADVSATIPAKLAIEGAVITFQPQECDVRTCRSHEFCVPHGLVGGDRCTILEVGESVSCFKGLSLVRVVLRRLPAS